MLAGSFPELDSHLGSAAQSVSIPVLMNGLSSVVTGMVSASCGDSAALATGGELCGRPGKPGSLSSFAFMFTRGDLRELCCACGLREALVSSSVAMIPRSHG